MSSPVTDLWAQRLIEATSLTCGDSFLDVGGADGSLLDAIAEQSGASGTLLDPCVDPSTDPANRVRGKAEALPFPDASFAAVIFSHSAHILDRPVVAMREAGRVLQPGGLIAIRFSSIGDLEALPLAQWDPDGFMAITAYALTPANINLWAKRAGLHYTDVRRFQTPFAGTYDQWVTGLTGMAARAWRQSGGKRPYSTVTEFKEWLLGEHPDPEPFRETLLTYSRS